MDFWAQRRITDLMTRFGRIALLVRVVVLLAACFAGGVAMAQPSGQADAATADRLAAGGAGMALRQRPAPRVGANPKASCHLPQPSQ